MSLPLKTFTPLSRIRRERVFSTPARVLVRKGQQVAPEEVIAQAIIAPCHVSLDLAASLGQPATDIERYLQFGIGDVVAQGDILAGPVGFSRRVVRAPLTGKIVRIQQGELVLQVAGEPEELKAGLPGEIVALVEGRGAVIELAAALIQGVWGNGYAAAYSRFVNLAASPEDSLTVNPGDERLLGAILVGGTCQSSEDIHLVQAAGAAGLLVSSLEAEAYEAALQAPFPIVVTEGFGRLPLPAPVFEFLSSPGTNFMVLDASSWDRVANIRPEAIIPQQTDTNLAELSLHSPQLGLIHPGQQVRLLGYPHLGKRARLIDLPGLSRFANEIQSLGAKVRLDDGNEILLPLTNLEFLD